MIDLTVYLIESSLLLGVLYLIYWTMLRKGRLFTLNRFYLLAVFVLSFVIPLIDYELPSSASEYDYIEAPVSTLSDARLTYYENLNEWMTSSGARTGTPTKASGDQSSSWILIGLISIYLTGMVLALMRIGWVYFALLQLKRKGTVERKGDLTLVKLNQEMAPFSFMGYVFVSGDQANETSFSHILDHERTHIREKHSIDLMIVQFLAALQWFNPAAWWLIKSLKTTHEYIADQQMISKGYSVVEYQTLLLQQLISNNSYGLVHNFNLSFIKKRIAMMKIQKIGWTSRTTMTLALSLSILIAIITVQCNAKLEQIDPQEEVEVSVITPAPADLPVIAKNGFKHTETENALVVTINPNGIFIHGREIAVSDIGTIASESINEQGVVILRIDRAQTMGLVRSVQNELRKADRRKILYSGVTADGLDQGLPNLLPPHPDSENNTLPFIDDAYIKANDIELLYLNLGVPATAEHTEAVYHFVREQMERQRSNYIVSAKFSDDDLFGDFLANLQYINEGFNRIYDERAKAMYGKGWWEIDRFQDEESRAQYHAVRKGIPRAISIAED